VDVESLRLLDGFLHEAGGDLVAGLARHVTQIVEPIQREDETALRYERPVGLLTFKYEPK